MKRVLEVAVKVETFKLTCDGCGATEELVVTPSQPDDVLLRTVTEWGRSHPSARLPRLDMGRWFIDGRPQ